MDVLQLVEPRHEEELALQAVAGAQHVDELGLAHAAVGDDNHLDPLLLDHVGEAVDGPQDRHAQLGTVVHRVGVEHAHRQQPGLAVLQEPGDHGLADAATAQDEGAVRDEAPAAGAAHHRERGGAAQDDRNTEGEGALHDVPARHLREPDPDDDESEHPAGGQGQDDPGQLVQHGRREVGAVEALTGQGQGDQDGERQLQRPPAPEDARRQRPGEDVRQPEEGGHGRQTGDAAPPPPRVVHLRLDLGLLDRGEHLLTPSSSQFLLARRHPCTSALQAFVAEASKDRPWRRPVHSAVGAPAGGPPPWSPLTRAARRCSDLRPWLRTAPPPGRRRPARARLRPRRPR